MGGPEVHLIPSMKDTETEKQKEGGKGEERETETTRETSLIFVGDGVGKSFFTFRPLF